MKLDRESRLEERFWKKLWAAKTDAEVYRVYQKTYFAEIREAAICRLKDQELLRDIALNAGYTDERLPAIRRLTDVALLAVIAREDRNVEARQTADERLKKLNASSRAKKEVRP